jgi:hypothetical protein
MSDASQPNEEPEETANERVSTVDALKSFRSDVKRQFPNEQDSGILQCSVIVPRVFPFVSNRTRLFFSSCQCLNSFRRCRTRI